MDSDWEKASMLRVDTPSAEKRDSVQLSVISEESRRPSVFGEELFDGAGSDEEASDSVAETEEEKRKRMQQEEVFIDKARAAMVVIGTKDIKDALERKKAADVFKKNPEAKKATTIYTQAAFLIRQRRYREAVDFLDRALKVDPNKKEWLTEKSRCHHHLLEPEAALKCINKVLKDDPNYFQALVLKGEILYSLWDLENAMLCFVEGRRMRPENTECILGMHKVRMALEEIAVFRLGHTRRRFKLPRSKSAKGRLIPDSRHCSLPSQDHEKSLLSSRRPSSTQKTASSNVSGRSTEKRSAKKTPSASASRSHKDENSRLSPIVDPAKPQEEPKPFARPKTARVRGKSQSRELNIEDIRKFVKESMSQSYRSSPSYRCFSDSTIQSDDSTLPTQSFSSSMEDVSGDNRIRSLSKANRPFRRSSDREKPFKGVQISVYLGQDKAFLDSLLKNKDLKYSKAPYTKRVVKIARELQNFVEERENYWKNRERFVRYDLKEDTVL